MLEKIRIYIIGSGNIKKFLIPLLVVMGGVAAAGTMWILALLVAAIFRF